MMAFKASVRAAHSASVAASLEDVPLPRQILRASTALVLASVVASSQSGAPLRAVEATGDVAPGFAGECPAMLTRALNSVEAAAADDRAERQDAA
jgi:hypothetical protein